MREGEHRRLGEEQYRGEGVGARPSAPGSRATRSPGVSVHDIVLGKQNVCDTQIVPDVSVTLGQSSVWKTSVLAELAEFLSLAVPVPHPYLCSGL